MRRLFLVLLLLFAAGCSPRTTHEEETGYQGKARVDPYLAATRFLQHFGYDVSSLPGWKKPDYRTAVLIAPVSIFTTQGLIREVDKWVSEGGHLICLGERAESYHNDWDKYYRPEPKLIPDDFRDWLSGRGFKIDFKENGKYTADQITVDDRVHEVFAESSYGVSRFQGDDQVFESGEYGKGRISVLTDARLFRNRYIDDKDNSALLLSLVEESRQAGGVLIVRDASLSFWKMLWQHGWPALTGLAAVTVFWLWKNMPGDGPKLAAEEQSTLRAYDHHLEALGDFHWRLDKAAGLLRPLRAGILERAQQQAGSAGHHDGDLFAWIGQRCGIPTERVQRAMIHETPGDPATFTRLLADLQTIHFSLS
jgi:hypothetical protein